MTSESMPYGSRTLFGHPTGLFTLFFAEMWERFSYYGMRALLVFYMIKGFLKYDDANAYAVYGAYTALVYMTPFFGGMLADRLLGKRKAVVIGGILMSLGHVTMAVETVYGFYLALALLICGNGFFKPNISTIVGTLYPPGSAKSDGGFTIFYMGINLGAAMSPLICGYIGETYSWRWGFGLAGIGMMFGLVVFVMPNLITQIAISLSAISAAVGLIVFHPDNLFSTALNIFTAVSLLAAGVIAVIALSRGGLPREAGRRPKDIAGGPLGLPIGEWLVYALLPVGVILFTLLVSGFAFFTPSGQGLTLIPARVIENLQKQESGLAQIAATFAGEASRPAGLVLLVGGGLAFGFLIFETFRLEKIARERMLVVLILTFFSMLFWSFFEQAGSSLNNFTDRNVDRVFEHGKIEQADVGKTLRIQPTQEQLGYHNGDKLFTMTDLDALRAKNEKNPAFEIPWKVHEDNVGMGIAHRNDELPASTFQAVNAVCILLFGLVFTALWAFLGARNIEPSTPVKFSLGLMQLALGFASFWYGARSADGQGMSGVQWLILGYVFQTTGELCLSPVGLSMVVRLSPAKLVSTVMGAWFLASAFAQLLAAIIAQFTGVSQGEGSTKIIPAPIETINIYGGVFGNIAIAAAISGGICLILSPLLSRWMHQHEPPANSTAKDGH